MKNICLFGDSISKGVIIDETKNRYSTTKQSFVNIVSDETSWLNIVNHSMLGCTISKGRSLIARHINDVKSCDIAVLEYGGNDSDHNWAEIAEHPEGSHLPKTPLSDFTQSYLDIIDNLRGLGKKMVMLNLPPIDERKYFTWFSNGLNGENILKWLGGSERHIYNFHNSYNDAVCNTAAENDIPLIDIRAAFLAQDNYSDFLCDDGIHPNEKGHGLIARLIESTLPELVYKLTGQPISALNLG